MTNPSGHSQVLSTRTPELLAAAVARAVELLKSGQVVALPTETVYGLAANAFDASAVARIFEIKGRPAHNPIIVHVADLDMARRCVREWSAEAECLARAFWPGPLTLVLPKSDIVPDLVTAGGETVGIRWPSHPVIQEVIRACGFPLAAPSANPSNQISPTTALHVAHGLGQRIPLIVDGGPSEVGIESMVLDLTVSPPRVLRPGMIHEESILAALKTMKHPGPRANRADAKSKGETPKKSLKSPGQLPKHYAPKGKLVVLPWQDGDGFRKGLAECLSKYPTGHFQNSAIHVFAHSHIPSPEGLGEIHVLPHEPSAYARALYGELHRCDERGAGLILVEALPETGAWLGIRDRLRRAAAS